MEPIAADEMVIEYVGQNIRQVRPHAQPLPDLTAAWDANMRTTRPSGSLLALRLSQ